MPRFSLIVPTADRTVEFGRLLESLIAQNYSDLELIVVDQNEDERLNTYLGSVPSSFNLIHIRAPKEGASRARNVGLKSAHGEIIAFPDDDCWYPPRLLTQIDEWFNENAAYDILSVGALDDTGVPSGNRWFQSSCNITTVNALRTTFCNSLFFRRSSLPPNLEFDESFFPGEETDLILRLMASGLRARFDRTWHIRHPRRDMLSGTVSIKRSMLYGQSMGQLSRKHGLFSLWIALLTYDLFRALAVTLTGRIKDASFCFAHALGIFKGIWIPPIQPAVRR
jgi:glycosyltransferase involved in cell wall biosynthesis